MKKAILLLTILTSFTMNVFAQTQKVECFAVKRISAEKNHNAVVVSFVFTDTKILLGDIYNTQAKNIQSIMEGTNGYIIQTAILGKKKVCGVFVPIVKDDEILPYKNLTNAYVEFEL